MPHILEVCLWLQLSPNVQTFESAKANEAWAWLRNNRNQLVHQSCTNHPSGQGADYTSCSNLVRSDYKIEICASLNQNATKFKRGSRLYIIIIIPGSNFQSNPNSILFVLTCTLAAESEAFVTLPALWVYLCTFTGVFWGGGYARVFGSGSCQLIHR